VGKTTMLREAARLLAETRRVVIVDTSNEIGGDGDVAHPAVGRARRMQVARPNLQHEVMIEAVENHNPESIVIDEIGRELEAEAARTIAERGVQLIGTAHGNTLENLLLNPTLSDLVGGIESVTLSDEEARRRGTQKTVLERRSPPTFDVLIEIQERERLAIHTDVAEAVDSLVRGYPLPPEIRFRDEFGTIRTEHPAPPPRFGQGAQGFRKQGANGRTMGDLCA
jgi:stage III sporulation protein SpoIIIAA